ncbi:MAG: HEAT repeat domain-containing protein [Candidatus Schekmanbacteria bacterium]|nr:HEAT repeat domain-containing protein [Candidatus Schekmanbacteria bacterium]
MRSGLAGCALVLVLTTVFSPAASGDEKLSEWRRQLKDPDASVRKEVATLLSEARGDNILEMVPALSEALGDSNWEVRADCAMALFHIGAKAHAAIPALTTGLSDAFPNVRAWSARALGAIGPEAKPAADRVAKLLADSKPVVRRAAAMAVVSIDPDRAMSTVPALVEGLLWNTDVRFSDDAVHRETAAVVLRLPGQARTAVLTALRTNTADKDPQVQRLAREALAKLEKP